MSKCTRCGKDRVVVSSYGEKVNKSQVTYTITACPDPACQKIVDHGLKDEEDRRSKIQHEKERAAIQRASMKLNSA